MEDQKITPELIQKAKNSKSLEELEDVLINAGINCSQEHIHYFANQLGILNAGELSDNALDGIAGGRGSINGQEVECLDSRVCKAIGLKYDPKWGTSKRDDGTEIWHVPYDIYEKAVNNAIKGK